MRRRRSLSRSRVNDRPPSSPPCLASRRSMPPAHPVHGRLSTARSTLGRIRPARLRMTSVPGHFPWSSATPNCSRLRTSSCMRRTRSSTIRLTVYPPAITTSDQLGIWEPPRERPSYLDAPGDPWILVSISSQRQDDLALADATLQALADAPFRVLVTLGPEHDRSELSSPQRTRGWRRPCRIQRCWSGPY